uniref:Uncharacterized protein n=1 Tax=Vespula pensylvanica TaxID=30213 RepID=A0A834P0Z2_VESPE|nr:hypothetical protein H0235_008986 [Vespula pensylvanica]
MLSMDTIASSSSVCSSFSAFHGNELENTNTTYCVEFRQNIIDEMEKKFSRLLLLATVVVVVVVVVVVTIAAVTVAVAVAVTVADAVAVTAAVTTVTAFYNPSESIVGLSVIQRPHPVDPDQRHTRTRQI